MPTESAGFKLEVPDPFTFQDSNGKRWDVELNMAAARRIDQSDFSMVTPEEISFLNPTRENLMLILSNSNLLFAMVWASVQPQVEAVLGIPGYDWKDPDMYQLAEEAFLSGINGKAIKEGREAFWRAIADFFPQHRSVLLTLMVEFDHALETTANQIAEASPQIRKSVDRAVTTTLDKLLKNLDKELANDDDLG